MRRLLIYMCAMLLLATGPASAMDVQEITSPSGISVWFVRDATTPTITVSFAFRGGSEQDPANKQGRSFLFAQALTEGTAEMDADVFQQLLSDRNISFGFSGGRESVGGTLRYLTRYEDTALTLAREAIHEPAFRAHDVARLKAQMQAGLRMQESDPDFRAARLLMLQTFGAHAYGQAARGTPTTVKNLTADDLRALHARQFVRARLVVVVVGDSTARAAARIVDRLFTGLPAGKALPVQKLERQHVGNVWYSPWAASEQNSIVFTAPAVPPTDPDYAAALILNDLVGSGGFRAMLMNRLRQELGATYGISASMQNMDALSFTMGQGSVAAPATDTALDLIRASWAEAREMPFDSRDIAVSKTYLSSSFSRDLTSSKAIAGYILGLRLARLPRDYADIFPKQLAAVTDADLQRTAQRLFDPTQLSFVIAGPQAPIAKDRTISDIWGAP